MRRRVLGPLLCLSLVLPAVASGAAKTSWAQPQIRIVTSRGLMGGVAATFEPDLPLTQGALAELVAGLTGEAASSSSSADAPVTMAALDASLVRALGLRDASSAFMQGARSA